MRDHRKSLRVFFFLPNQKSKWLSWLALWNPAVVTLVCLLCFFLKWDRVVNVADSWEMSHSFAEVRAKIFRSYWFWLNSQKWIRQWVKGVKMDWFSARIRCIFCMMLMVSSQSICLENQLSLIFWYLWYFLSKFLTRISNVSVVCSRGNKRPRYHSGEN